MTFLHPEAEYGIWTDAAGGLNVYYWLSLFHEIDFQVNEGFRRIPHGGIEIGGLLFGSADENAIRIEAFRNIECEHSRGPSFVLSERDLNLLREQIAAAPSDSELKDLQLLGWFVAHTRSPLGQTERESALFEELFPAGKVMIVIKPERFQPTRFLFLLTDTEGTLRASAPENAIILPLPGRAQRADARATPLAAPAVRSPAPEPIASREEPVKEAAVEPEPGAPVVAQIPDLPSAEEIRRRRSEIIAKPAPIEAAAAPRQITQPVIRRGGRWNAQLAIVLFIAAALGCGVGYTIYLQLPPAVIPLEIQKHNPMLTVSWPREQTRDAVYAALRVDDGDPIPLSAQQKSQGQADIPSRTGNVKIELVAQHWMRNSRGIVRYVEPVTVQSNAAAARVQ